MPLNADESLRLVVAMKASREARERGDFPGSIAAYAEVGRVEKESRRRLAPSSLESRVNELERRLRKAEADRVR